MLGVKRNEVLLAPHDADWANQYQMTKNELISILGDTVIHIYHVGSTAIKGIVAKPILDVAVELNNVEALNIAGMEAVGYDWCGEHGSPGRYLFVRRREGDISTHHIHCYTQNHENLSTTVAFCSYLNSHPEYARQYSDLKEKLASKYPKDRVAYTDAKAEFITMILAIAKEEQGVASGQWMHCPTDAPLHNR